MTSSGDRHRQLPGAPVLLVEDDPHVRNSMKVLLELDGFKVVTAANGAQALRKLRGGLRPGLILLDLTMPVMDGFEFRKQQMQDEDLSGIPVVVLSGHFDPKADERLGAIGHLHKPVAVDTMLKLVEAHCSRW